MAGQNAAWSGRIHSLTHEGMGVGIIEEAADGKTMRRPIFIPKTAPGDLVEARVTGRRSKYFFGELVRIIEPSPHRTVPRCPHYGVCGGCDLQHITYEEQLVQKAKQVAYLLERKGIMLPREPIALPSRRLHKYRWRSKIFVEFTQGRCVAGYRKARSHEIVPIGTCFIVAPQIMEFIALLGATTPEIGAFTVKITIVVGEKGKIAVLVPLDEVPERKQAKAFFEELYAKNRALIGNLFFEEDRTVRTSGQVQEHCTYRVDGLTLAFLPETFIQSNVLTNEVLVREALRMLAPTGEQHIIDLYAGIGNFSLPIAKRAKQVTAVEGFEPSVLVGRTNALRNGIENVSFIHRSTEKYLKEYIANRKGARDADAIVLDPPRTGIEEKACALLLEAAVPKILYISCNPVTLAADLAALASAYAVRDIICVDMFPDISHVETIVLLERSA